jgi:hypothetical protein
MEQFGIRMGAFDCAFLTCCYNGGTIITGIKAAESVFILII